MCASTLCPLDSSTRNIAFGRASTMVPSSSITPSFLGMSSHFCRRDWLWLQTAKEKVYATHPHETQSSPLGPLIIAREPASDRRIRGIGAGMRTEHEID